MPERVDGVFFGNANMRLMSAVVFVCVLFCMGVGVSAADPFKSGTGFIARNHIDELTMSTWNKRNMKPADMCSDEVFLRRIYLDMIGTLPEPFELRNFLKDSRRNKRAVLIDSLFERDEFADYWAMKWCDVLRVKAEFPINLWPNSVQAYYRWINDSIGANMPYDEFARDLLTSSGSNFRVPPVNFYRAIQGQEPSTIAAAVGLTFMGCRVDNWPEKRRANMEVFFSRVQYKPTSEWKEEIVCLDPSQTKTLKAVFPDGKSVKIEPWEDPRKVFADWLISSDNEWFARSIVNRIWAWLLGRGLIHEPDDIRPDNPAKISRVLVYLERELVKSDYDLRHIYRLILNSGTYQQSSIPNSEHPETEALFACYPVRQLEAEVLIDALCWISGTKESYSSPIPEPFSFIPENQRSIALADGSISSKFLEMFGRPARDTGLESERDKKPTDAQRLHMLNSTHIQRKIDNSWRLKRMLQSAKGKRPVLIRSIYTTILSRDPTQAEQAAAEKYLKTGGVSLKQGTSDLAWALVNTKEFLYKH